MGSGTTSNRAVTPARPTSCTTKEKGTFADATVQFGKWRPPQERDHPAATVFLQQQCLLIVDRATRRFERSSRRCLLFQQSGPLSPSYVDRNNHFPTSPAIMPDTNRIGAFAPPVACSCCGSTSRTSAVTQPVRPNCDTTAAAEPPPVSRRTFFRNTFLRATAVTLGLVLPHVAAREASAAPRDPSSADAVCSNCSGSGKVPCELCSGTGFWRALSGNDPRQKYKGVICPECEGTGILTCPICLGTGEGNIRGLLRRRRVEPAPGRILQSN